jgi:phage terminase small subunit
VNAKLRQLAPPPPDGLSAPSGALWRRIHDSWVMDDAGRSILETICRALDRKAVAEAHVEKDGLLTGRGGAHPLLAIIRDCDNITLKAWRLLGLEAPAPMGRPAGKGPA